MRYLVPMLLVPVLTLVVALVYALARPEATTDQVANITVGGGTLGVPLVSPGGVIGLGLVMPAFTAFAVMVGLQWSIRSKGTIGSVVSAVLVVLVVLGVVGLCGASTGRIPVLGSLVACASPINLAATTVMPEQMLGDQAEDGSSAGVLIIGAMLAAVIYGLIVWGMHGSMKRSFMMTVRRLAGTK